MIAKVGPKGQVVIPKALRDELGIGPGSSVVLRRRAGDDAIEVRRAWDDPIRDGPRSIRALTPQAKSATSASDELLRMRREDETLWQEQFRRWSGKRSSSTPTRSSSS
jgi:AbrB family looped-hinge helix DNA binding protein